MISPPQKKQKLDDLSYKSSEVISNGHGNLQPNPFFGSSGNGAEFSSEEDGFSKSEQNGTKFEKNGTNGEAGHMEAAAGSNGKDTDNQCSTSKKSGLLGELRGFRIPKKEPTETKKEPTELKVTESTNDIKHENKIDENSSEPVSHINNKEPKMEKECPSTTYVPRMASMSFNGASKPKVKIEEPIEPPKQKEHYFKPKRNGENIIKNEAKWYEPQTFYPTYDEFKDLQKYMNYLETQGAHLAGICKIVPPKEWIPRRQGYNPNDIDINIQYPVQQNLSRGAERGAFRALAAPFPPITVRDYVKLATKEKFLAPPHNSYEELEELYWEQQYDDLRESPVYGADTCDSITDEDQKVWNIRRLDSLLTDVLDEQIPGVNMPYLYFGMWKATFSWHVEDMDLYSVNFLHYGAPKTWYCVPPQYAYKLETVAAKLFPEMSSACKNMMRHKCCMISPKLLAQHGVRVHKMQQEERNMIVVFPHAYHSGFNHGFNIAESTNFALRRWVEYGKRFRSCTCGDKDDKVAVDMEPFVAAVQPDKLKEWKDGSDWDFHPDDPEFIVRAYNDAEEKFKNDEMPEKDMRKFRRDIKTLREVPEWYTKKYLTKDCGKCIGCENKTKDDCGECEYCLDMPKFGGLDNLSLPCIEDVSEEEKICPYPIVTKYEDKALMMDAGDWDLSDIIDSEDEQKTKPIVRGPRLRAGIRDAKEKASRVQLGNWFIKTNKMDPKITEEYMEKLREGPESTSKITEEDVELSIQSKKGGGKGVGFAGALSEKELLERKSMSKCTKGKQHRFNACKKCEGCLRGNCGECVYCQDMPRFGGMGVMKQKCETRNCVNPVMKMCPECVWTL